MEQIYQDLETEEWKFPLSIAYALKDRIYRELGFTVNIGVSENKLLAKMASDFQKPNKVHTLYLDEVPTKMWKLPIGDLFGCGKRSAERLRSVGILRLAMRQIRIFRCYNPFWERRRALISTEVRMGLVTRR
jgi:DNA polymerase-4